MIADGKTLTDKKEIANKLKDYFVNIELAAKLPKSTNKLTDFLPPRLLNTMHMSPTDTQEVLKILKKLDSNTSPGPDSIPSIAVKSAAVFIAPILTSLINSSLSLGVFPDELKLAKVTPIYKSGDTTSPNNYRPISMLNIVSKVFESVIAVRLQSYLESISFMCQPIWIQKKTLSSLGYFFSRRSNIQSKRTETYSSCNIPRLFQSIRHLRSQYPTS